MGLAPREDLDIVDLVFYVPALLLSLWCIKKHGFGRQSGWVYLAILAILRIVGAGTGIVAYSESNPSTGLLETTTIAFTIGISPLLLALLGILARINSFMRAHALNKRALQLVNLPVLVGLALAIVGGVKEFNTNPTTVEDGYKFVKIGVVLYLVGYIVLAAIGVYTFSHKRDVLDGEHRLLLVSVLSLPFLLVRIIYSLLAAFYNTSSAFSIKSTSNTAVIVQAIMSALMEFIVVAMFLAAGLTSPAVPRDWAAKGGAAPPAYVGQNGPILQQSRV